MEIKLKGLDQGEHIFDFNEGAEDYDLDKDQFPESLLSDVKIDLHGKNYYIKVLTKTKVKLKCDRCLDDTVKDHNIEAAVVYTEDNTLSLDNEQDDLVVLAANEDTANLNVLIKQNLLLDLPMKNLCKEDCKGLCSDCGAKLNDAECACRKAKIDPRWEALNKLKNNL